MSKALDGIAGVRPLPPQPEITRDTVYCYVFQFRPGRDDVARDLFVAAVEAEGIPCDGRFYEPVYRSDLLFATPENCPQLTKDYSDVHCPVSERAAYRESVWLPQFVLIGEDRDVEDIAAAVEKVTRNLDALSKADPALAGVKALSRAERPRREPARNY